VRVRTTTADDIDAVLELWLRAEAEPSVSDDVAGLTRLLEHDPEALLVAESGGRIVGSLIAGVGVGYADAPPLRRYTKNLPQGGP
jgi:ribosomal protein S18 acetylase RimI-like enzyme